MLLVLLLGFVSALAFGQQPNKSIPPIPTDRRADAYAIYSAVLARPSLSHPDKNEKYLIEEFSGFTREEQNAPQKCIGVPEPYRTSFAELLADRAAHSGARFRLERAFSISKPYDIVAEEQAAEFRKLRNTAGRSTDDVELFRGATDLITLGNVYFDRKRTLAAVYTWSYCGNLCAYGTWRVFVNRGGFQEQNWIKCMTIADARSRSGSSSEHAQRASGPACCRPLAVEAR